MISLCCIVVIVANVSYILSNLRGLTSKPSRHSPEVTKMPSACLPRTESATIPNKAPSRWARNRPTASIGDGDTLGVPRRCPPPSRGSPSDWRSEPGSTRGRPRTPSPRGCRRPQRGGGGQCQTPERLEGRTEVSQTVLCEASDNREVINVPFAASASPLAPPRRRQDKQTSQSPTPQSEATPQAGGKPVSNGLPPTPKVHMGACFSKVRMSKRPYCGSGSPCSIQPFSTPFLCLSCRIILFLLLLLLLRD